MELKTIRAVYIKLNSGKRCRGEAEFNFWILDREVKNKWKASKGRLRSEEREEGGSTKEQEGEKEEEGLRGRIKNWNDKKLDKLFKS